MNKPHTHFSPVVAWRIKSTSGLNLATMHNYSALMALEQYVERHPAAGGWEILNNIGSPIAVRLDDGYKIVSVRA